MRLIDNGRRVPRERRWLSNQPPAMVYDRLLAGLREASFSLPICNTEARHIVVAAPAGWFPCGCRASIRIRRVRFATEVSMTPQPAFGGAIPCMSGHDPLFWGHFGNIVEGQLSDFRSSGLIATDAAIAAA